MGDVVTVYFVIVMALRLFDIVLELWQGLVLMVVIAIIFMIAKGSVK